jgi:hypothetical protein
MSLINLQQTLARIYTDSKLRDDFLTNPDVVGNSLGLNCQEIQQLSNLSRQQVNLFANSLKRKRLGKIRKLLPLTNEILGKEFDRLFFKFSETYLPTGDKKHLLDSIAFSKFLEPYLTTEKIQPLWLYLFQQKKWSLQFFSIIYFLLPIPSNSYLTNYSFQTRCGLLDILRYETIKLKMFQGKQFLICDRFNYNLKSLIDNLHSNSQPILKPQPTIGIWFKLTSNSNWRSLFIRLLA